MISEKSTVEKICDHIEADMLYYAPAFQDKSSALFRVKLSGPAGLEEQQRKSRNKSKSSGLDRFGD